MVVELVEVVVVVEVEVIVNKKELTMFVLYNPRSSTGLLSPLVRISTFLPSVALKIKQFIKSEDKI